MAMLRTCSHEGCVTKTLGNLCLRHEPVRQTAHQKRPVTFVAERAAA